MYSFCSIDGKATSSLCTQIDVTTNTIKSFKLNETITAELKLLLVLFNNQRNIFYRDSQGRLFACKKMNDFDVEIHSSLLEFLSHGAYLRVFEVKNTLKKKG